MRPDVLLRAFLLLFGLLDGLITREYVLALKREWVRCPFNCRKHGTCLRNSTCDCYEGFTGADCSLRTCQYGTAWASKPYALDSAHSQLECSGKGICNRKKGRCKCFHGFEGEACSRVSCGDSSCNGRGTCLPIGDIYTIYNTNRTSTANYTLWDHSSTMACICDHGYTGASCETRLCPMGDDPLTISSNYITFNFTTSASWGYLTKGSFLLSIFGESVIVPASASSWNSSQCSQDLVKLRSVSSINCSRGEINESGGATYMVQIRSFPSIPRLNNIFSYDSKNPSSSLQYSCIPYVMDFSAQDMRCSIADLTVNSTETLPEYKICSNRGTCNTFTGLCECYSAFTGPSCNQYLYNSTYDEISPKPNILSVISTNANYSASMVRLVSVSHDYDYDFIQCTDKFGMIFKIDGQGNMYIHKGGLIINQGIGMTIGSGGLAVSNGITVYSDGLYVNGSVYSTGGLVSNSSESRFTIKSLVTVSSGPLYISDGLTITRGSMTLHNGSLNVVSGGLRVRRGLSINGNMSITTGGMYMRNGLRVTETGLYVNGGLSLIGTSSRFVLNDGVFIYSGGYITNERLNVTNGGLAASSLTIRSGGLVLGGDQGLGGTVTGSMYVPSGGLKSTGSDLYIKDGVTIFSGGISINGTITGNNSDMFVSNGGLTISQNVLIPNDGMYISEGLTISSDLNLQASTTIISHGMNILAGGLTTKGNLYIENGGISVHRGGIVVESSGLTVKSNGLYTSGRLSIGGRLIVTGGMTIRASLSMIPGLNVNNGGLYASGAVNVADQLIVQSSGISIKSNGLFIESSSVSVDDNGVFITSSNDVIKVTNSLVSDGLLQVDDNGLVVSGGLTISSQQASNMFISDGLSVSGSIYAPYGYLLANNSYLYVSGGITLGGEGDMIVANRVKVSGGIRANSIMIKGPSKSIITGGLSIKSNGLIISSGLTIDSKGMTVQTGGITIGGPIFLTGGLSISSNLRVSNGLTISGTLRVGNTLNIPDRMYLGGGITATSTGFEVTGGMTLLDGGIAVSSGSVSLTNSQSSVVLSGGLTISQGPCQLHSAKGITIHSGGVSTQGTLTIAGNANIANGLTVVGSASVLAGGVRISSGGAVISRGLTVSSTGSSTSTIPSLSINAGKIAIGGDLQVASGASYIEGLSVTSDGLAIAGGLTVASLFVSNGLSISSGGLFHKATNGGITILSGGLMIDGSLTMFGHAHWFNSYSTSDERLKSNIQVIDQPLEKIQKMKGVYYNWKSNIRSKHIYEADQRSIQGDYEVETRSSGRHIGVIAQDVLQVVPELVYSQIPQEEWLEKDNDTSRSDLKSSSSAYKDNYISVNYHGLIPLIIEGIKELNGIMEELAIDTRYSRDKQLGDESFIDQEKVIKHIFDEEMARTREKGLKGLDDVHMFERDYINHDMHHVLTANCLSLCELYNETYLMDDISRLERHLADLQRDLQDKMSILESSYS